MNIVYKDIPMEFVGYTFHDDRMVFTFQNNGVEFSLYKWKDGFWYFKLCSPISYEQQRTNKLFLLEQKARDRFQDAKELRDFVFTKSPLRMKLLLELGPGAYEKYK